MSPSRAMHPESKAALVVDRYAVYDEFAAGGMATVHFARLNGAHGFRRTVAVKRLLPHLTRDQDFALMLIDEARLASRVRHHNVVSTLDVVQTADELLLVMEYVHGESLAKLMRWSAEREEPVPVAVAAAIMVDALHGLHAAHEAKDEQGVALGLVHRDVSPQNVLVGLDGITRIADFGIAKAAGRAHSTRGNAVKGKLAYMAPEQLSGGDVSRVSDVFAAAIVLWEVLTGERLFAGSNHAETVFKLMSEPILPPSARRAELTDTLDAIVLRGLEREPGRRFASAREMALALEGAAPSVRPSEIASWVERVVGDRLAQRACTVSAIERDVASDTQAQTVRRELRAPLASWHSHASALPKAPAQPSRTSSGEPLGETGTQRRGPAAHSNLGELDTGLQQRPSKPEPSLQSGLSELTASLQNRGQPREVGGQSGAGSGASALSVRNALIACSLVALLGLLCSMAWRSLQQRTASTSGSATLPADLPKEPDTAAIESGRPRDMPPTVPLSRVAPQPALLLEAGVPARPQGARANERARPRPAQKSGARACDPPYSIDPAGRVLFKVECM